MIPVRTAIFLLLASVTAFAQGNGSAQAFDRALDEELAKRPNGEWLYGRSEVYRKTVLHQLAEKLHLGTAYQSGQSKIELQSAQHFSGDISNDVFGQEETSVAISRNDPNRIIVASNDEPEDIRSMPVYLSTNAGMSWNTSRMPSPPKPYIAYGDPFVIADQYNGFFYAFLIDSKDMSLSNIMVAHSTDGVLWTYYDPVIHNKQPGGTLEDKESIAIDLGTYSPVNGRIYVSWTHTDNDSPSNNGLQLAWSDNAGFSWSAPIRIDSGTGFFSQVKVDGNGNVFYTYSIYRSDLGLAEHYLLISYDQGATFIRRKIADFYNYPYSPSQRSSALKGEKGIRAFPYIAMDYDGQANTLHAVYGSYKKWNDSSSTAVLYYTSSKDQGKNWSPPYAIGYEGDSAALHTDRFMPWIGVDQMTGNVHIVYYSSQDDPKNIKIEAYRVIFSKEGQITYTRISDSLFDPLHVTDYSPLPFVGDYNGCAMSGTTFAYAWTENRKGLPPEQYPDGEIYAFVSSVSSGVSSIRLVSARSLAIFSAYPNPAADNKLTIGFAIPQSGTVSISLSAIGGALSKKLFSEDITSGTYEKEFDITGISSGNYVISLESGNASVQKKIVVVH